MYMHMPEEQHVVVEVEHEVSRDMRQRVDPPVVERRRSSRDDPQACGVLVLQPRHLLGEGPHRVPHKDEPLDQEAVLGQVRKQASERITM